jgi:hypothetical protein
MNAAAKTGDNAMQKQSQGYGAGVPLPTVHLRNGGNGQTGDLDSCDTFNATVVQKFFTTIFFSDAFDRMHMSVPSFAFPFNLPPTFSHPQAIPIITNVARSRPAGTPNNHQQSRLSHPHLVLTPVDPMGAFQCR